MDEDLDIIIGFLNQQKEKTGGTVDANTESPLKVDAKTEGQAFQGYKQDLANVKQLPKKPPIPSNVPIVSQTSVAPAMDEEQAGQVIVEEAGDGLSDAEPIQPDMGQPSPKRTIDHESKDLVTDIKPIQSRV